MGEACVRAVHSRHSIVASLSTPALALPPGSYQLLVSSLPDRSGATLVGNVVSGDLWIFVDPETDLDRVRYLLDDRSRSGPPNQVENNRTTSPADRRLTPNHS